MINSNHIIITGNFDGGNPQNPKNIIKTGSNAFTIIPYSEDNDPNYKFRLDVKVFNHTPEIQKLHITIDWQEPKFNHLRNYVYVKNEKNPEWTYLPMNVSPMQTYGKIILQAGETYLCLHPKYNYEDFLNFINRIPDNEFISKEKFGATPQGRDLWMVKIGRNVDHTKKRIMLVTRIHPYETSGSFCAEGIVDHFFYHRSPFTFDNLPFNILLIPMANPDGVYHGLCKKTSKNGLDLAKQIDPANGVWLLLKNIIDDFQPRIYCEFHNWMFPDRDGIYFLNWLQARKFIKKMPSQRKFKKVWKPMLDRKLFALNHQGLKQYCKNKFGSLSLCLEYPWRNRAMADMKKLGIDTVKALTSM